MIDRLEYLSWCPDRETFLATMADLINPVTVTEDNPGVPLAALNDDGVLIPSEGVRIDEIGPVVKSYDPETGDPLEVVDGHHVNLWAIGALADLLDANGGWEGIFPLLGDMQEMPQSETGVPQGWQGTSGMRIYPRDHVTTPVRVWA